MDGTRNIIIAIIKNKPPDVAADMLIRLFGVPEEPDQPNSSSNGEHRRPRRSASPVVPPTERIEPAEYYSVEVMRQHTGYSSKHIYTLVSEKKVTSKLDDNGRRLILGSDILRLRKARGITDESPVREVT